MRFSDLAVILFLALLWYGAVPVGGAFLSRRRWRDFRRRFSDLCHEPLLDYAEYARAPEQGGTYRFIGGFESAGGGVMWVRGEGLTVPVFLDGADIYILPMAEGEELLESLDPKGEAPEKIRWDQISSLSEGAKVFVGGRAAPREGRPAFAAARDSPVLIIFYDGAERSLALRTIRAGRNRNEYWNLVTPYAFALGALSQLFMALLFLSRPLFRLTAAAAGIALAAPLFLLLPPGLFCTLGYQRLWRQARIFRIYRDILRFPLNYMPPGRWECRLPGGERYGAARYDAPPLGFPGARLRLAPAGKRGRGELCLFGRLPEEGGEQAAGSKALSGASLPEPPGEPADGFAPYAWVAGNPETLARRYTAKAYILEILSWLLLMAGMGLNLFFVAFALRITGVW